VFKARGKPKIALVSLQDLLQCIECGKFMPPAMPTVIENFSSIGNGLSAKPSPAHFAFASRGTPLPANENNMPENMEGETKGRKSSTHKGGPSKTEKHQQAEPPAAATTVKPAAANNEKENVKPAAANSKDRKGKPTQRARGCDAQSKVEDPPAAASDKKDNDIKPAAANKDPKPTPKKRARGLAQSKVEKSPAATNDYKAGIKPAAPNVQDLKHGGANTVKSSGADGSTSKKARLFRHPARLSTRQS
jgi:hypothetical protein